MEMRHGSNLYLYIEHDLLEKEAKVPFREIMKSPVNFLPDRSLGE
jgi:hypothetical protein